MWEAGERKKNTRLTDVIKKRALFLKSMMVLT